MDWMARIRFRVLAFLLGLTLAVLGTISLTTLPAWPVVGVAFAAAAVAVNHMTSRLKAPVCHGCGARLSDEPPGAYGVVCAKCGFVTLPLGTLAKGDEPADEGDDEAAA
ncbi:MAG TPA: hypothetical protein PLU35_10590 [Phycisphaerales bacterium]|nr:hypothetical protein [Phycisphaerales bacterium]